MLDSIHPGSMKLLKPGMTTKNLYSAFSEAETCRGFIAVSKPKPNEVNMLLQAVALPNYATFYEFLRSCNTADDKDNDLST